MKKLVSNILPAAMLAFILAVTSAGASDCASEAQQEAAKRGAELLGVADLGDGKCEAKLLLPPKNGKPGRVVTRKFNG